MVVAQTKRKGLPRVDITPTKRKAITIYHDQMGISFRWIALNAPEFRDTSASHTSIARSYESTKEQGCNYNPRESAGRPRVLSTEDMDKAEALINTGEVTDGADLQRRYLPGASSSTIRRALCERGLQGFVRRKKPLLTCNHQEQRRQFAQRWRVWTDPVAWNQYRIVFSDESKFNLDGSDGRRWCRRKRGNDVYQERTVSQRVKRGLGSGSVMVWGCITREGVGPLCRIEGRMDRFLYIEILEVCYTAMAQSNDP